MRGVARKPNKKKTPEKIKEELLLSILEVSNEGKDYLQMNKEVRSARELKDGIALVNKCQNHLKGANKGIINIVGKLGEILKKIKEEDDFFNCVSISRFNIYFKVRLQKFLCTFSVLKNSTLTPSYFKSNFKLIKKVCKSNADVFDDKK